MSIDHMRRVFRSELPSHLRMVLIAIADGANDDGVCWPGQTKLSDKAGVKPRTLRDHLARLQDDGYLTVEQRGSQRTNVYTVTITEDGQPESDRRHTATHPDESDRRHTATPDRRHTATPDRRHTATPPIGNPQIEPLVEPPSLAPAVLETPAWVDQARVFPTGTKGVTDDELASDAEGWRPDQYTAHVWQVGTKRRDLLWEALDAEMPISNDRERGRRSKAVKLMRESGVDPSEVATLHRVYQWKSQGKWADTDLALAGRVADCRRWANDVTTIPSAAAVRSKVEQARQKTAMLRLLEAGPGDPKIARGQR